MSELICFYDTTLYKGDQTKGVQFIVANKVALVRILDNLGIKYRKESSPLDYSCSAWCSHLAAETILIPTGK